jgi:hypothetical protein
MKFRRKKKEKKKKKKNRCLWYAISNKYFFILGCDGASIHDQERGHATAASGDTAGGYKLAPESPTKNRLLTLAVLEGPFQS